MLDTQITQTATKKPVKQQQYFDPIKPQTGQIKPPSKPWYQSKTIWFNAAVASVGVATAVTPQLEPYMTADTFAIASSVIALANTILRFITKQPVSRK